MATSIESRPLADLQEEALIKVEEEWARRAKGARPWSTAEYLDQVAAIDLAALPPVMVVPGIGRWLGWSAPEPDDSIDPYEAYLNRISQETSHA